MAILVALLYFAIRNVPLIDIWGTLTKLRLSQLVQILVVNAMVIVCISARWWIIVRAENPSVPFLPMIGYRLSVFGLSYFTPGPQVGGEPLQVIYLQRNHNVTFARATSAVIMDKLLEFLVNFVLIAIGTWVIVRVGLLSASGSRLTLSLIGLAFLLIWPVIHIFLLNREILPISSSLQRQPFIQKNRKGVRLTIVAERMASAFCKRHLLAMFLAFGVSMLAMVGMMFEYFLMADFLGMRLAPIQVVAAMTFMQAAFLLPIPAGLGALEASQVFVLGAFGYPASAAISLTLLIRARDLLNGGVGLMLASRGFKDTIDA